MLVPDPPVVHYVVTLTLSEVEGERSRRLGKGPVLKSRSGTLARQTFERWLVQLPRDVAWG